MTLNINLHREFRKTSQYYNHPKALSSEIKQQHGFSLKLARGSTIVYSRATGLLYAFMPFSLVLNKMTGLKLVSNVGTLNRSLLF